MFESVIDLKLIPKRPYEVRQKTDLAVFHHVEGHMTARAIHEMHMRDAKSDYAGIAYNLYIDTDGKRYWGRGPQYAGGHVANGEPKTRGVNARSFGAVCNGNFNKEKMSDLQKQALFLTAVEIVQQYAFTSVSQLVSHREIAGIDHTDCPGDYFPMDELRRYILGYGTAQPVQDSPKMYRVMVGTLNFRQAPDLKAPIIGKLHFGDLVELGRYVEGEDWARVIVNGKNGWVWLRFIGE